MAKPSELAACTSANSHLIPARQLWRTNAYVLIGLMLCLVTNGCSSEDTKRRNATTTYWAELTKLSLQFATSTQNKVQPTTPTAATDALKHLSSAYSDTSDAIIQLPSTRVDAEVVALAADYVQMLSEGALIFHDMHDLLEKDNLVKSHAQSPSLLVESFLRGALGDPLGTTKDLQAVSQDLTAQGQQLQARMSSFQRQAAALDAREMKLRAMLSEKYGGEFPPLSSPRKPKT